MDFGKVCISGLNRLGHNDGEFTEGFYMCCFNELLNDPAYKALADENGIDRNMLCAAPAQLKTGKYMGFSSDRPFDVKGFWGLTDSEVYAVAASCPKRLLGFLISAYAETEAHDEDVLSRLKALYRDMESRGQV